MRTVPGAGAGEVVGSALNVAAGYLASVKQTARRTFKAMPVLIMPRFIRFAPAKVRRIVHARRLRLASPTSCPSVWGRP